LKQMNEA